MLVLRYFDNYLAERFLEKHFVPKIEESGFCKFKDNSRVRIASLSYYIPHSEEENDIIESFRIQFTCQPTRSIGPPYVDFVFEIQVTFNMSINLICGICPKYIIDSDEFPEINDFISVIDHDELKKKKEAERISTKNTIRDLEYRRSIADLPEETAFALLVKRIHVFVVILTVILSNGPKNHITMSIMLLQHHDLSWS